jgi:hypothetical protein
MVKVNKIPKFDIQASISAISSIVPIEFVDININLCGLFEYPSEELPQGRIEVNANHSPIVQFQSVIHEFVHFIDIVENGNGNNALIDSEVIAFAAENVIINNVPIDIAIRSSANRVRDCYPVGFSPCMVEPADVEQVVERVRAVIGC